MERPKVKGYIAGASKDFYHPSFKKVEEVFKGEVKDEEVKFPRELGAKHPFEFEDCEKAYSKVGLLNGVINKIADSIVGDFIVECKNPNVKKLIDKFIYDNNFSVILRSWIREGLIKGNGFIEIDSEGKVKVLNANNMYVKRNTKGIVLEYNQWVGSFKNFSLSSRKLVNFKPHQIAHLKLNDLPDSPYGIGLIYPSETTIENMVLNQADKRKLIQRKAGAPIHVRVGQPGESANPDDIDSFRANLQYMTNTTEWVTDGNAEMKVLDFGDIGKNITDAMRDDLLQLIAGLDVPEVLLNSGQLNEGIAKVQLEGWQRRIMSYQDMIENIIVTRILNPYLKAQGLSIQPGDVDFIWNLPGTEEINARVTQIQSLLASMNISENIRRMLELELGRLLELPDYDKFLRQPEVGLDDEKEEEANNLGLGLKPDGKPVPKESPEKKKEMDKPQPEVPGREKAHVHISETDYSQMSVKEFIALKEQKGFTYSDYLLSILNQLKISKFEELSATEFAKANNMLYEDAVNQGLLTDSEINKLRTILKEGFRNNNSMNEITERIKDSIQLKDRITNDGKVISAETRPEMIARTETLWFANKGLIELYKDNGVKEVQWLAVYSDRTCETCMALDGNVMTLQEQLNKKDEIHPNCRCSAIAI